MPQTIMSKGSSSPYTSAFAITPGDTEFTDWARAIYVGGAGHLVVVLEDDSEVILFNALAGTIYPLRAKKVLSITSSALGSPNQSTTATSLVGLF